LSKFNFFYQGRVMTGDHHLPDPQDEAEPTIGQAYRYLCIGALADAARVLDRLLDEAPDHPDVLQMRGMVFALGGKPREAVPLLQRASMLDSHNAGLLGNLARALWESGQGEDALAAWERVMRLGQGTSCAWSDRGTVLAGLRRFAEALASFDVAIALEAGHADAWTNRGNALHELGNYEEALISHDKAIALEPEAARPWVNKASTLDRMHRHDEALTCYATAIALAPKVADTWSNRGVALRHANRLDEAMASFDRAIAIDPACINAWLNRGALQDLLRQHAKALLDFEQALLIVPGNPEALSGDALARLAIGEFQAGWEHYEHRWKCHGAERLRHERLPLWLGEQSLEGKRILLWAEQGLGDTIQFCRYAPLVARLGAEVVLEVPASLNRLMTTLGECRVVSQGETLPECDFQTPLLSLPLAFKTRLDSIPVAPAYLHALESDILRWRNAGGHVKRRNLRTAAAPDGNHPPSGIVGARQASVLRPPALPARMPLIGIACSGNPTHARDASRSMPLAAFAPLQKIANLVLLQKDVTEDDTLFLRGNSAIHFPGKEIADFADTAAIVAGLDLVISVDTALAHLAGALGAPVWILLPWASDWRWQLERSDSPWYPSARLFRQDRPGNWEGVMARVFGALAGRNLKD
jgi:tetratricopeptide (TPR) repeat protein